MVSWQMVVRVKCDQNECMSMCSHCRQCSQQEGEDVPVAGRSRLQQRRVPRKKVDLALRYGNHISKPEFFYHLMNIDLQLIKHLYMY